MFESRQAAGRLLAQRVGGLSLGAPAVLAVGEEGREVAEPVAARLGAPLIVYRVIDLVLPWRTKLAFGAITDDNHHYLDAEIVADHALGSREVAQLAREQLAALRRPPRGARPAVKGAPVLVVADALATGYRALAVAAAARAAGASRVVLAAPVAARDAAARIEKLGELLVLSVSDAPRFDAAAFFGPTQEQSASANLQTLSNPD